MITAELWLLPFLFFLGLVLGAVPAAAIFFDLGKESARKSLADRQVEDARARMLTALAGTLDSLTAAIRSRS